MNQQIVAALQVRLKAFAAAQSPVLRIAFEGVALTPNATETYLADHHLPANTDNPSAGVTHRNYRGIFQVDVIAPGSGNPVTLRTLADALIEHFPRGLTLQVAGRPLLIERTPSRGPVIQSADRSKIPISIGYSLHAFITPSFA